MAGPLDITLNWWDRKRRRHIGAPTGLGNLRQMWAFGSSGVARYAEQIARRVGEVPRIIQVEHPWSFGLGHALRRQPGWEATLLAYDAHNIEAPLQEAVWRANGQWRPRAAAFIEEIARHEAEVAAEADVCWATSESDARELRRFGAKESVVVANGVSPIAPRDPVAPVPALPYLLFVGSSHVPNVQGFMHWLPAPLVDLPPGTRIVLAGSVGNVLAKGGAYAEDLRCGRLVNAGVVPRAFLDQLIRHAHGLLLPIETGGGTNLKTAEALLSCRPAVATVFAMRGFERYENCSRVRIARFPEEFRAAAVELLRTARLPDADDETVKELLWDHVFDPVRSFLAAKDIHP